MDITNYLIILNGKDQTEDIIHFEEANEKINIKFKNNSTVYKYNKNNAQIFDNPIEIDIINNEILVNDSYIYNLKKILKFSEYYRVFFKDDTTMLVDRDNIKIVNKNVEELSTDTFKYLKDISRIVSITTESGKALLTEEYEKINVIERDTALYKYLNSDKELSKRCIQTENIIFPFGSNHSQMKAVKNALENQISVIEGPPGTGKTQTILNIIANIIKDGKTVAIVSNNNSATDNVYEKLEKYGFGYICAQLGRKENKDRFINNQTGEYPEFKAVLNEKAEVERNISRLNNEITQIFTIQNNIAKLKELLGEIDTENKYFNSQENTSDEDVFKIRSIKRVSSNNIMRLKVECEDLEARKEKINFWFKLKSRMIYGIGGKNFYKRPTIELIQFYDKIFLVKKNLEIKEEINENVTKLRRLGNDNKLEELKYNSLKIFHEFLRNKFSKSEKRKVFSIQDLYKNVTKFIEEYPIVFSTTYSIKNCLNLKYKFDYIIMDESSQVDLITGAIALSVAKNAVIVGDEKQLPNVITEADKIKIEEMSRKYRIKDSYNYIENSFLKSIENTLIKAPRTLLKEHYRCHPKIIGFCNKKFYDNQLIIMTEDKGEKDTLKAYVTVEGNHARERLNQRQIDVIKEEVLPEVTKNIGIEEIGIITPYKKQKEELEKNLESSLAIDTVHKFQGREKEGIVLTTVDNEISEFVDDPKMLNVAVTRAKQCLRLVVSNNKKNEGTNIDDLLKYIQYNNFEIVQSNIKSIYDLLYEVNRIKRLEYLKNKKRISEHDSENITYNIINEILKVNNFNNLKVSSHVTLSHIFRESDILSLEEKNLLKKDLTHVDFLIYNKMDKKAILGIEVDGYENHKEGTEQKERDRIKDKIFEKNKLPLLRLSTIGSDEMKIIKEKIEGILDD